MEFRGLVSSICLGVAVLLALAVLVFWVENSALTAMEVVRETREQQLIMVGLIIVSFILAGDD